AWPRLKRVLTRVLTQVTRLLFPRRPSNLKSPHCNRNPRRKKISPDRPHPTSAPVPIRATPLIAENTSPAAPDSPAVSRLEQRSGRSAPSDRDNAVAAHRGTLPTCRPHARWS